MKKILLSFIVFVFASPAFSESWKHEFSGSFPVFFTVSDTDQGEQGARIMSGFNPASVNISSMAPTQDGLDIKATLQITSHLQGSQVQNSGLFESRVADIQINGDFGQLNIGKGFGIFNSNAIGDAGSGKGVGHMPGDAANGNLTADQGNATNGRIGTGYVYANFNPRIIYSNKLGSDHSYKLGLFNPEEPSNTNSTVETPLPRIEGQFTSQLGSNQVWAGFMYQPINSTVEDYDIQAMDIGALLMFGKTNLRLAYTLTEGIGADGLYGFGGIADAGVEATQSYAEVTHTLDKLTLGFSYGLGQQDAGSNASGAIAEVENTLAMVFLHRKINDHLHLMLELQSYGSETSGVSTQEYTAVSTGLQVDF